MKKLLVGYVAITLIPLLILLLNFTTGWMPSFRTGVVTFILLLPELQFLRDAISFHPFQIVVKLCISFCVGSFILHVTQKN